MKLPWPLIALAIGLGVAHLAVSLVFGVAAASAIVAAIGIAYAALNFLLGKPKGDTAARTILARIVAVNRVTYVAIAIVWLGALSILAFPVVDRSLSEEFAISVHDELRQPVADARIRIIGSRVRMTALAGGVATVKYYPSFSSPSIQVEVESRGVRTTRTHRIGAGGRYADLTIAVWSGQQVLRAAYFTVTGLAISSVLEGRLPDDLKRRYPNLVSVIPNSVYRTTRNLVNAFDPVEFDALQYSQREERGGPARRAADARWTDRSGEAWLRRFQLETRRFRFVRQLSATAEIDFSQRIFGAPADLPLPRGFAAMVRAGETWSEGTSVLPTEDTDRMLAGRFGAMARGENGALSVRLERALTRSDLELLLRSARWHEESGPSPDEVRRYLRFLIGAGAPTGLVRGVLFLDLDECANEAAHMIIQLPEPKLRFTILQNASARPVPISSLVLVQALRQGFGRAADAVAGGEEAIPHDVLGPGEAILVPTELSIDADYRDEELRTAMGADPPSREIAQLRLLPQEPPDPLSPESIEPLFTHSPLRPRMVLLPMSQVSREPPSGSIVANDEAPPANDPDAFEQQGPNYVIGTSVREIAYVVNGVRMLARSDSRMVIAMVGIWEGGSCPFVFAHYPGSSEPVNLGQVISNQRGASRQGTDRIAVGLGFTSLQLRELEDEITHIDMVRLAVRGSAGTRYYYTRDRSLARRDGRYAILHKGDRADFEFNYVRAPGDRAAALEVNGYFVPVMRSALR